MAVLQKINNFVWGAPTLILILILGVYLTIRTGFSQFSLLPRAFSRLFIGKSAKECRSSRRALCTALSATVGTGNLAGVAGAIALGGPGVVFWMWICGFLGMILKFAEATLAVVCSYRDKNGNTLGGPMYMIRDHLPKKYGFLGVFYAFFGVVASIGVGNATQINAVVTALRGSCLFVGIPTGRLFYPICGMLLSIVVYLLLSGGAKRIGDAAVSLVPAAAILYLLLALGVLILQRQYLPDAFSSIFRGAFSPRAVTGGVVCSLFSVMRIGISRGVFTSEAGMGTAAIAHGEATVSHPVEQGLMGILEVFIDTILICTLTALVILVSSVPIPFGTDPGAALTSHAFCAVYGSWVSIPFTLILCLFAFATVLGWSLYGIRCAQFLFGAGVWKSFPLLQSITVLVGAMLHTGTVWLFAEIVNGLMAIPNLIVLFSLTPTLLSQVQSYRAYKEKSGA